MSTDSNEPIPTEINLHRKSRMLVISFSDGARFELPAEYLRVFSKAKEVRTMEQPVIGKERVNIERIEPQGQYAVQLVFDDGHDTGIYSWGTLYELGERYQQNWQAYLQRLQELGIEHGAQQAQEEAPRRVRLLYFTYLVKQFGRESEEVELPARVDSVEGLIDWLRRRRPEKAHLLKEGSVQVTVNRQFAEPFTRLDDGDEIALVPTSPIAPVAD